MRIYKGFVIEGDQLIRYNGNDSNIIIPDGIKYIKDSVFADRENIVSVTIPEGVIYIGWDSFMRCKNLRKISLPNSLETLSNTTFWGTEYYNDESNWENGVLYIGNALVDTQKTLAGRYEVRPGTITIARRAFNECHGLTEIIMPNTVIAIGQSAFQQCENLDNVVISENVSVIEIFAFTACQKLRRINLPAKLERINYAAFAGCECLEDISFPKGIKFISEDAFYGCRLLKKLYIPNNMIYIDKSAFRDSGIQEIYVEDITIDFAFATEIRNLRCLHTKNIDKVPVSLKKLAVRSFAEKYIQGKSDETEISNYLSYIKKQRKTLLKADSNFFPLIRFMVDFSIFPDDMLDEILTVTQNEEIKDILLSYQLKNPTPIKRKNTSDSASESLTLEDARKEWKLKKAPNGYTLVAYKGSSTEVIIPAQIGKLPVIRLGELAFENHTQIEKITIPDSLLSIGYAAFEDTAYFNNEANWDNDVLYIGKHLIRAGQTINGTYEIKEGTISLADMSFARCQGVSEVIIPNSVKHIGEWAFSDCNQENIFIPESVIEIDENALSHILTNITVAETNPMYTSIDGNLYSKDGSTLVRYAGGLIMKPFCIPQGVTTIERYAFPCPMVTRITIPSSVRRINGDLDADEIIFENKHGWRFVINEKKAIFVEIAPSSLADGTTAFKTLNSMHWERLERV